ncbi:MAG: GspE/PulE family protein [Bacilli bacterium]|nr:GspE/PulE family protein [Bacilli bacterium]MDD4077193.1 GspE/PulE family protein [Bacilli bacterium]
MDLNRNLADFYINDGIIEPKVAEEALERAKLNRTRFDEEIIKMGAVDEVLAKRYLAGFFGLPFLEFNVLTIDLDSSSKIPLSYIKDNRIFPISLTDTLTVAIDNPSSFQEALNTRHFYHLPVKVGMITVEQMDKAIVYLENKKKRTRALQDFRNDKQQVEDVDDDLKIVNAPAVQLTDSILKEAVSMLASDIHFEPFEKEVRIRHRIDGVLIESNSISKNIYQSVLARYKIMSNMNIAERRVPQDGKIRLEIDNIDYDFRVSTIPTIYGEKIVIRIFENSTKLLGLGLLGNEKKQIEAIENIISKPYGIILVTGPTGSGKSTTLYTFLRELNKGAVNITTVEDPVENVIEGINQVQVNPKANLTFSTALRSILRQDPNIIMIGEIRDEETAQMAIRAAITGHLVLATLHTNDAIGTLDRLVDMGVPAYLVHDALIGAIAQRLVRKLCPHCKKKHKATPSEMELLGITEEKTIYEHNGCNQCNFTGYLGRTAVFEILTIDEEIRTLLSKQRIPTIQLKKILKDKGMMFLEDSCRNYVLEGVTSIDEFNTIF